MNSTLRNCDESRSVRNIPARLIVWEKDGSWARHLRRLLTADGPRVYETRTSATCGEMVAESPASMVVALWTTSTARELTSLVTRFRHGYPAARTVAVGDPAVQPLRWRALETGIVWLCTSPRELKPVVEIVQRHFDSVPEPPRSSEQRIWDGLPWQNI